jgi:hypothetical protein
VWQTSSLDCLLLGSFTLFDDWAAAGSVDMYSSSHSFPFAVHRAEISQRRVTPPWIIEALDIVRHVGAGLIACAIDLSLDALGLERGEEALHCRVVPAVAGPAHGVGDAVIGLQPLDAILSVLAALIGVAQQCTEAAAPPDRHPQRIGDHLGRHRFYH